MTLETTAPPSSKAEVLHGVCLVSIRAYMTKLGRRYSVLRPRIMGPFCQLHAIPKKSVLQFNVFTKSSSFAWCLF